MGEVARRVLCAAVGEGEVLRGIDPRVGSPLHPGSRWDGHGKQPFSTADLFSVLHDDPSGDLVATAGVIRRGMGITSDSGRQEVSRSDCLAARRVCMAVVRRAARVVAAGVVACAQACEPGGGSPKVPRRFAVEIDGSVFTRNRVFGEETLVAMDGVTSNLEVGRGATAAAGDGNGSAGAGMSGPAAAGLGMDRLILEAIQEHPDVPKGTIVSISTHREASAKGSALVALRDAQQGGSPWGAAGDADREGR